VSTELLNHFTYLLTYFLLSWTDILALLLAVVSMIFKNTTKMSLLYIAVKCGWV